MSTARIAVLITLLAPAFCTAQAPAAPKKVATVEGITEYRLDNGLRVLLFPDPATPNVTVNLTVMVGSRHEGYGETGMAHLLEHMVFKGTPTHGDIPKALKEHGADFNGSTWVDRTNYYETMPGTNANLEFGIKLEADRMVNSFIKRDDLITEMTVVRNEFESGENSPSRVLSQRMMAAAYEWHNYGKSTIGNRSDIERVPIDRLQAFYKKYYRPDNAMLVIAGKFEEAKALEFVTKYFGALKNPAAKLDATYTEEPAQDGERIVTLRRVGKVGVVGVIYHIPAAAHEDFAAVEILNSILATEPSGRLYKALVPNKRANRLSSFAFGWHDPGVMEISAEVATEKGLDDVRETMLGVLENLGKEKVTAEEVDRAKARAKRNFDLLIGRSNAVGVGLSEWGARGDWRLMFLHRDRVAKVSPEDVMRVANKYLQRSNRTVGVFIPTDQAQRSTIPETPVVADLVKDYKGGAGVALGEAFDPTPENIEKRVQIGQPVKDGPQVAALAKKSRAEAVTLQVAVNFGNEKSLQGMNVAAQLLGPLMARGTEKLSREQLQDELAALGARLSVNSGMGTLHVSVETNQENYPKVVKLLIDVLRHPALSAVEFEILKRERRDLLQKGLTEPTALASRALQRRLSPYGKDDVRYIPTIDEEIIRLEAATLDQVKQLHAKQLGGQASAIVVVGDAKGADMSLIKALADWKAEVPYQRIARPANLEVKGGKDVILTPDKANAYWVAGHDIGITDSDPDFAALEVANYLFGGGTLSSRIGNRVRQKEGLSYGAASLFGTDAKDKAGRFSMRAICNPENIDKVDRAVKEELDLILKDGVGAEELEASKKAYLEHRKVRRSTDAQLAGLLGDGLENERTMAYHVDLEKKVAALTPDMVNAAIRKHWQPSKLVFIRAGDFKQK
ncbi:MAG: insulinase family protein [Gemmataceae bacterium]|nr:insulinase family protein [Gemmataceae bacterium]